MKVSTSRKLGQLVESSCKRCKRGIDRLTFPRNQHNKLHSTYEIALKLGNCRRVKPIS